VAAFENRLPEPKPNRITDDEDKHKSQIINVKLGLKLIANKKLGLYSSSPAIANAPVGRC